MSRERPSTGRVVVAEPDSDLAARYARILDSRGFTVATATTVDDLLRALAGGEFDLLLLELTLSPEKGLNLLRRVKDSFPAMVVHVTTAVASVQTAVDALKAGARDYVLKPIDEDKLLEAARKAIEIRGLGVSRRRQQAQLIEERRKNLELRTNLKRLYLAGDELGISPAMLEVRQQVRDVADTDSTVLILGESGTGKGRVAQAIHYLGARAESPFVVANCSIYSEGVLQSELFGHEKGAFTGAIREKPGRFEVARDGTVFLDEIGELPGPIQVMLLRVLQERRFERVGGNATRTVDARIIAATNRDLRRSIDQGHFREDLFYRLNVIPIRVPPLRERAEDIPHLAAHFLEGFSRKMNRPTPELTDEAMARLQAHGWPGNVRELENAMERAVVVNKDTEIGCEDLPREIRGGEEGCASLTAVSLQEVERQHVLRVLRAHGWNKRKSAQVLGIDRSSLYNKLKRWGIDRQVVR